MFSLTRFLLDAGLISGVVVLALLGLYSADLAKLRRRVSRRLLRDKHTLQHRSVPSAMLEDELDELEQAEKGER